MLDAHRKALDINLDKNKYGTIAEIGAGQETARWFFQVGGAAGTIAKAISAYDMKVSDSIYGPSSRYVSQDRVQAMIDHEYRLVIERLTDTHSGEPTFFAFANTVAARSFTRDQNGHGWLGIKFQHAHGAEPSQIIVHVNLKGKKSLQDQETLGLLGVNIIYGALHHHQKPEQLMTTLMDGLYPELVEIDMIDYSGAAFAQVDNRLMALRLVQHGLTHATLFEADGSVVHAADALYKKSVLIERSRFRPPTKLTVDMLDCAHREFIKEPDVDPDSVVVLSEMTLHNLLDGGDIDTEDFLHRAEILCALGKKVLVSNYGEYHRLAGYIFGHTQKPVGIAMGLPTLQAVFDEKYYENLGGGILESFGRLFKNDLRLYICPCLDHKTGKLRTLNDIQIEPHLKHLYSYLYDKGYIKELNSVNNDYLSIYSHDILANIRSGGNWETSVPDKVAKMIKEQKLFGCNG